MDLRPLLPSPLPGLVNLVVEIPAGSRNKYEYSAEAGIMALDRVLHSSVRYPFDYGFVPNTLAEDGSPLDAMVIMGEPTFAGCLILARPIGVLDMHDSGFYDGKLLCVPVADQHQRSILHSLLVGWPLLHRRSGLSRRPALATESTRVPYMLPHMRCTS